MGESIMTIRIINNEDDMERSIMYAMELASVGGTDGDKRMELSFPSRKMMEIFMQNLFTDFYINEIPIESSGIDLVLNITENKNNGECEY